MAFTIEEIIDQSQWELFVLRYSPSALFQSWAWGEVQHKIGIPVFRFGVYESKKLIAVYQVVYIGARRGSFLHVRHGPVVATQDPGLWDVIFAHLRAFARTHKCWFVRVNPLIPIDDHEPSWIQTHRLIPAAIHSMDGEHCWILDLEPAELSLLSAMRKSTRYEIRRADKDGVEILKTANAAHLSEFFDLYKKTSDRHGFIPHMGIREEFEVFSKKNQALLYIAKLDQQTVSSAIILFYGNQAIYHHGASIPSHSGASSRIQWEAITDAKKRGMNVYNFWGIGPENNPRHPWRGITLFKKGFGGREIVYIHAHDMPLSAFYVVPRSIETLRRFLRGYN